jgi:hypothetical protein
MGPEWRRRTARRRVWVIHPRKVIVLTTTFHTVEVDGLNVFYREAGDPASPKLLLLGGSLPRRTSSAT